MAKKSVPPVIRLRGVRHNNLKNFDLDLPLHRLIVVTGLSGSGKSSLAFDTLFAEGQRRYIETFSPYARQFFDRMDKPQADSIEGIPPAIAIEQRNSVKSTRSTVGTMTEICDYMKLLWPHVARLHCRQCGQVVRKDAPQQIWETLMATGTAGKPPAREVLVTFTVPVSEKLSLDDSLALISKQGYQRLALGGETLRLEDAAPHLRELKPESLTIIQDRLKLTPENRPRFVEACEQAYHFGKGKLALRPLDSTNGKPLSFSNRLHCAQCDIEYREPSPALFSFNHPVGACPDCRGFGRIIAIDYDLALPDRSKTLAGGAVRPWQTGQSAECQADLAKFCRIRKVPMNVPFRDLPAAQQTWVIDGDPGYGRDKQHEWPRAWYGIKGYFRWLESKSYKMHVRVLLSRYRSYRICPACQGLRFQPESLLYKLDLPATPSSPSPRDEGAGRGPGRGAVFSHQSTPPLVESTPPINLGEFYRLPIRDALAGVEALAAARQPKATDPLGLALNEVRARLGYLNDVGLGYLTLDRPTRSLSGGETERVSLTTCLGTRLVNTLFVLDEPSVGLHPRDTSRLVRILEHLRNAGNTVVVVEHEASVMRAADQIIDLGPGHGAAGGQVVFQGPYADILQASGSLTGQYLSGAREIATPPRRPVNLGGRAARGEHPTSSDQSDGAHPTLTLSHATLHNLHDLSVTIPLARFVCLTGVSGSGKTTLAREILLPLLAARLNSEHPEVKPSERLNLDKDDDAGDEKSDDPATAAPVSATLTGAEHLGRVVLVDQSTLGKTPRSNPAVYIGAFEDVREVFAQSELAAQRGLNASAFSFNSSQGQCERCRGAGFEKIEMQFLSDVFVRCPECHGRRYRPHILDIKIAPAGANSRTRVHLVAAPNSSPSPATEERERAGERVNLFRKSGAGTSRLSPSSPPALSSVPRKRGSSALEPSVAVRGCAQRALSIADLLESTVDEAVEFLGGFSESRAAQRAARSLQLLQEVGLGYLKLGQPINTLSGGESQRLKLVRHLADFAAASGADARPTLFLFDEPTTGLHFDDVRVLLQVFQRLVDAGHSVLIIEHNLDVIKSADWVIDLGPDAGDQGGELVTQGTPEQLAAHPTSHTGMALREVLERT